MEPLEGFGTGLQGSAVADAIQVARGVHGVMLRFFQRCEDEPPPHWVDAGDPTEPRRDNLRLTRKTLDDTKGPDASIEEPGLRHANVSKFFRFLRGDRGDFVWSHVPLADYKPVDSSWRGVTRRVFIGQTGESPAFHLRYFEIEKGGFTTLERHQHEHAIAVMRGRGQVLIGSETRALSFGDVVYVAPGDPHQFRNDDGDEPFGFLCVVNAVRDRPQSADSGFCRICE